MIRLATVGTGWIVDAFLDGLFLVNGIEHRAVYSRSEDTAKRFIERRAEQQAPPIRAFTDLTALAESDEIDSVYIASPNSLHFSQSMLFLKNKKHVICEKSVTVCKEDAKALFLEAERQGVVFMEAIMLLHLPELEAIKSGLNEIGPIRTARFDFQQYSSKYDDFLAGGLPNIFNAEFATGCLMDIGVYCVYPALMLFGEPDRISASSINLKNGIDGAGTAIFSYDNGPLVTLTHSKICEGKIGSEIVGEKGIITIGSISKLENIHLCVRGGGERLLFGESTKAERMSWEAKSFVRYITKPERTREEYERNKALCCGVSGIMYKMRRQCGIKFLGDKN